MTSPITPWSRGRGGGRAAGTDPRESPWVINDFDDWMMITTAPTGGLRPLAATGAEGLKQPSKGSPPLISIIMFYCYHNDDNHNNYDQDDEL